MGHLGGGPAIQFIERYGYALLFFWILAEQGALPIPSVPLLVAVGALVRAGRFSAAAGIACCLAGGLVADSLWFYLGRWRGKAVLRLLCRLSLEPDSCVRQTENRFLRYGLKVLLVSKFLPGLNAVAAPLAGDSGTALPRFLAYDSAGIVIWSTAYMAVGYIFAGQLEKALDYVQRLGSGLFLLVLCLLAAWVLWKYWQRRRFLRNLEVARISPEELLERMESGEELYVVDLRSGLKEDETSVPGALRLSAEELAARSHELPRDREIILFCS